MRIVSGLVVGLVASLVVSASPARAFDGLFRDVQGLFVGERRGGTTTEASEVSSRDTAQSIMSLNALVANTISLYRSQPDYGSPGGSLAPILVAAGVVPAPMLSRDNTIVDPAGRLVTVMSRKETFAVTLRPLSPFTCREVLNAFARSPGQTVEVQVGDSRFTEAELPLAPAKIATLCAEGPGIVLVFR